MGYLGTPPQSGFITTAKQRVTSSTNNYVDLDHSISSIADVIVFVNFVKQDTTNLTLTTSTRITLGGTLVSSDIVEIHYLGKAVNTQTPGTATVTNDMLAGSIALDKLSATGTKSSSTFLRGDNTFAEAGGGSIEYIQGGTSSSNATLVAQEGFVDTSKYAYYKIWFYSRGTTEAQTISSRFRNGGSELTVNNYRSHISSHYNHGEHDSSLTNTYATIETDMSTRTAIWEFDMFPYGGINTNSSYLVGRGFNYKYNSDNQYQRLTIGGFLYNENVAVDGIQFERSGGFANHEIRIYGVKP